MKIVDMHCDTISRMDELGREQISLQKNELHMDIEKMRIGDYLLQNFAIFINQKTCLDPYETCKDLILYYHSLMKQHKNDFLTIEKYDDIRRLQECGKIGSLLTMEEGAPLKGNVEYLHYFYQQGVRMLTLTWNYPNEIGYPGSNPQGGLTKKGIEIVREMERIGMIIDVSHGSDALFWEVLQHTKKPFVASHSNARAVCNVMRNLSDDMIRALATRGGVMGMNFYTDFIKEGGDGTTYLKDLILHIQHIYKIGGIECIGLGSDFDGIGSLLEWKDSSGMGMLHQEMKKAGFTETQIEQICYKNVLRLYYEVLT